MQAPSQPATKPAVCSTHGVRLTFAGYWPCTLPGGAYWQTTDTHGWAAPNGLLAAEQVATPQPTCVVAAHTTARRRAGGGNSLVWRSAPGQATGRPNLWLLLSLHSSGWGSGEAAPRNGLLLSPPPAHPG